MAEFLNNESLKDQMGYYHFRGFLIQYVGKRIDELKVNGDTEYDYCTQLGQLKELKLLLTEIKKYGKEPEQETNETNETKKD